MVQYQSTVSIGQHDAAPTGPQSRSLPSNTWSTREYNTNPADSCVCLTLPIMTMRESRFVRKLHCLYNANRCRLYTAHHKSPLRAGNARLTLHSAEKKGLIGRWSDEWR